MADYLVPMAAEMPDIECAHVETPTKTSMLGGQGAGESGDRGAPAAIMNAVTTRCAPLGAKVTTQPITPGVLLRARARCADVPWNSSATLGSYRLEEQRQSPPRARLSFFPTRNASERRVGEATSPPLARRSCSRCRKASAAALRSSRATAAADAALPDGRCCAFGCVRRKRQARAQRGGLPCFLEPVAAQGFAEAVPRDVSATLPSARKHPLGVIGWVVNLGSERAQARRSLRS